MEKPELYFIAIIPPPEVCEAVIMFKQDLYERFGSKAALKVVPHITLKAPFKLPADSEKELRQWFRDLVTAPASFVVRLNGFGAFPKAQSPVLFIRPENSPELSGLQQRIIQQFSEKFPHLPLSEQEMHYHPHMTIAYRDLDPEQFRLTWLEYEKKEFIRSFFADSIHLLHHNGKQWEVIETRAMNESQT